MSPDVRLATCRAAGPARVAGLSRAAFELLYRSNHRTGIRFQEVLLRQLAAELRSAATRVAASAGSRITDERAHAATESPSTTPS